MIYVLIILDVILLIKYTKSHNKILKYLLIIIGIVLILPYPYLLNWELTVNYDTPSIMALPFALLGIIHLLISFGFIFKQK